MLNIALGAFLLAIIAALFGFNVIASTFAAAAQIAFWVFVVLFVISLIGGLVDRSRAY